MHQPWYQDTSGKYTMPWVFLHAIKDYYEMPWLLSRHPGIKATFNLVPSLLEQLEEYGSKHVNDPLIRTLYKPAVMLSDEERAYLLEVLFWANHKTMIYPLPRYQELYQKKGYYLDPTVAALYFSDAEITDLSVLFLLAWCGNYLRQSHPIVAALLRQGANFSHQQKVDLLDILIDFIPTIIPFYRQLAEEGRISITTTPYYHPILPLLIDPQAAKDADPTVVMPNITLSMKEDAKEHVARAQESFARYFGEPAKGCWPAEGSLSPAALSMLGEYGIEWVGADEELLAKSIGRHLDADRYRRWRYVSDPNKPLLFFRDKKLSDFIGFTYSGWSAKQAAADFIARLEEIGRLYRGNPLVCVFLDGENAWEYYYHNGFDFFEALYSALATHPGIQTLTFAEAAHHEKIEEGQIERLGSGSWIGGVFSTWIGHPEKNRAWELLAKARQEISLAWESLSEECRRDVMRELMIAQGSDWFWWYGDDHPSAQAPLFDNLFRSHLVHLYELIGREVPDELYRPIKKSRPLSPLIREPIGLMRAVIDGRESDYFEWRSAGRCNLLYDASAMDSSAFHLDELWYGHDHHRLYLAITGHFYELLDGEHEVGIDIMGGAHLHLRFKLLPGITTPQVFGTISDEPIEVAYDRIIELSIALKGLIDEKHRRLEIVVKIFNNKKMVERAPLYSAIVLNLDDKGIPAWVI